MAELNWNLFFEIHRDNLREGPGDSASTEKAYALMKNLPSHPLILDIGCGPGMQTMDLIRISGGSIVAVDIHQAYLHQLQDKVNEAGLHAKVSILNRDMHALNFDKNSFDVIWSEGAIYIIGFEMGLKAWKPYLKKNGYIAVTEVSWLKNDPPEELNNFWKKGYPAIQDIESNLDVIKKCGFDIVDHFTLPESAWLDNYYASIESKLGSLEKKHENDPSAFAVLQMEREEIAFYRKYSEYYGYEFFVMKNTDGETL